MKKYLFITQCCMFASITSFTFAIIIESNSIISVLSYIQNSRTLVICDIDNTLARPKEELSSDEWFCHLVNTKMEEGYDYLTSIYYSLPIVYYAQFNVLLTPTESIVPYILKYLINNNIPVMALTTRSLFVAERTFEQLETIDIEFFVPDISQEDLVLRMSHPCFYKKSILFSGNNDKGEALVELFKYMDYVPESVIFIDDKMKYILSVEKALENYNNIPFIGIRYSGCDERVKNFNPNKAEQQLLQLRNEFRERHHQSRFYFD